ncbi:uncharacterized protein LOC113282464 [Papaver somniferum]|uniref:uncharacterized protein LOC113282464 n=1 Tax=Papaver somniferum TaxID=3469 RepID=UPI000E6FD708|nr:uncharacterized protein LOC113282464 [Papaver somniferum]
MLPRLFLIWIVLLELTLPKRRLMFPWQNQVLIPKVRWTGLIKIRRGVVPQSHAKVRIPLSDQIGKVLNASSSQRSLLSSVKPIFKESSGESSQDEGDEVNNSEASTQTPSDSSSSGSSTGEDSPGPSGGRRMDSDVTTPKCKEKISLDSIFKRSKSYKKARDIASQSQAEDPAPDIVLDSQV